VRFQIFAVAMALMMEAVSASETPDMRGGNRSHSPRCPAPSASCGPPAWSCRLCASSSSSRLAGTAPSCGCTAAWSRSSACQHDANRHQAPSAPDVTQCFSTGDPQASANPTLYCMSLTAATVKLFYFQKRK
jgi:hypothetical protein